MTIGAAGIAELVLGGVATGASIFSQKEAEKQREQALNLRLEQEQAATNERKLQTEGQVERVLASQVAGQAASGFTLSSPSFGAIQVDTLNNAAKDLNADNLNLQFQQTAIAESKEANRQQTDIGIGTSLFDAAAIATSVGVSGGFKTAEVAIPKGSSGFNQQLFSAAARKATDPFAAAPSKLSNNPLFRDPFENLFEEETNPFA
jgi:hypothetical protein